MNELLPKITDKLEQISEDAAATFGHLSSDQLNWKPREDSWSIAQCFDHLIKSNEAFNPEFKKFQSGNRKNSFWENYSPLTRFFGNFLLKSLKNDAKKFKAPSKDIVPPSDIAPDIIERFVVHQKEFGEKIKSLEGVDMEKTVVTSPFLKLMTYRLRTAFEITVEHEKRHFRQAQRVFEEEGFPR